MMFQHKIIYTERNMFLQFMMIMCLFSLPFTNIAFGTLQGSNYSNSSMSNIAKKPGCETKCGNVTVPYPFGIGSNCSLDVRFSLTCEESSDSDKTPQLFLDWLLLETDSYTDPNGSIYRRGVRIHSISDSELRVFTSASVTCYQQDGNISFGYKHRIYVFNETIFTLSEKNKLTVIGCDDSGLINGGVGQDLYASSGCYGLCNEAMEVSDGLCSGKGCCQTSITKGLNYYSVTLDQTFGNHKRVWDFNRCGYAFVGEEGSFQFHGVRDISNNNASEVVERIESTVPVVIDWVIAPYRSCSEATECKDNSHCYDVDGGGYRCKCNKGYEGNPYHDSGCHDINECNDQRIYPCHGYCNNTRGGYECNCSSGYFSLDAKVHACKKVGDKRSKKFTIIFILGVLLGTGIIILAVWLNKIVQKRKDKKLREKFYKRNGGLLLQQQTLNGEDVIERTRIFSARELEKATDQYNMNRIVGRGGQGTVYKGMLPDGKIVAVKKSVLVDETQVEPFINEVFLLSQISHRNVVKLLGCCLETEVPVLVYEFVSNGDLFQFIHDENYEFPTLWSIRVTIATEVAGALAYMHSATSVPIYHRDIKSSNILLDEKFRAKLSDFGISKSVMGDQTHLSTLVKGTYGYLDPEYFQSNQFTEKSDVYSFGIVLVELLTGKKPIYSIGPGESRSLATLILSMEEELILENIDDRVSDGPKEQLIAVSKLAKKCLNLNGKLRPTMKEVAIELEGIRSSSH